MVDHVRMPPKHGNQVYSLSLLGVEFMRISSRSRRCPDAADEDRRR